MFKNLLLTLLLLSSLTAIWAGEPVFPRDPAISPDGKEVCFVYDDDLWIVPFNGGDARRITSTEGSEWSPMWSPDGKHIAYNSNREGLTYVYLVPATGGAAKPILRETYSVADWFADGQHLLCVRHNMRFGSSFYKVPINGERPVLIGEIGDRFSTLSADNKSIIFNRYGDPHREAYHGSLAGELWKLDIASGEYSRLTNTDYTERYPRASHTRDSVYFCASDGELFQIYRADNMNFANPVKVTALDAWSARDITIARQNDRMVFEYFDQIWKYDPGQPSTSRVSKLDINIIEDQWQDTKRREIMRNDFWSFAISPDELLLGFLYKYDAFFMPRKGGDAKRVTFDQTGISGMEFIDERTMLIQKMDKGREKLFTVSVTDPTNLSEVDWFGKDSLNVESFFRDEYDRWTISYSDSRMTGRIAVADPGFTNIRAINVAGPVISNFALNKSGSHAIYSINRPDYIRELYICEMATDTHTKLMNDDAWSANFAWTRDNKSVLLTRGGNIFRLDLVPRDEFELDKDNWEEILAWAPKAKPVEQDSVDAEPKPETELDEDADLPEVSVEIVANEVEEDAPAPSVEILMQDIEKRLYPIITDAQAYLWVYRVVSDTTFHYISNGTIANRTSSLRTANIYGKNIKEELRMGETFGNIRQVGKTLYYMLEGGIRSYNLDSGRRAEIKGELVYDYDMDVLNTRVFEEAWGVFGRNFYDPNMHGRNWNAMYQKYLPYVQKARNIQNIATIIDEMIGDLNASHTGFYPREDRVRSFKSIAYLGMELDYRTRLEEGIRINLVYPGTRLAQYFKLQAGDVITHIDGVAITKATALDDLLVDKVGKRVRIRYLRDGQSYQADMNGLSFSEQRRLDYDWRIAQRRALVQKLTDGRVGYIHIPAMGSRDYENFTRELYRDNADKQALIIDVRGNTGGRIHDQLLTLLMKKKYGYSTSRRFLYTESPEPFRVWDRPSIVLVDERSFSDGEIFPIIYQELKLGKVVGIPSSGAVIGTWQYDLLDGSSMRLPGSGWYKLDGTNMEGSGAMPDIIVENTPNDVIADRDPQLQRAIEEILKELPN